MLSGDGKLFAVPEMRDGMDWLAPELTRIVTLCARLDAVESPMNSNNDSNENLILQQQAEPNSGDFISRNP